jgi:cellulose synthase operon protein C
VLVDRPLLRTALSGLLLLGCAGAPPAPKAPPPHGEAPKSAEKCLEAAQQSIVRGDDAAAEKDLQALAAQGSAEARYVLGKLLLLTGRPEEVLRLLPRAQAPQALLLRARAQHQTGEVEVALDTLAGATKDPAPLLLGLEIRLARGTWLFERGQRKGAERELLAVVGAYDSPALASAPPAERALALAHIGRAAHLLGAFQDANQAFEEAEQVAPASVVLLLWRAELFLEKYDAGHAREVLDEAAALEPKHPDVLFLRAALELEATLNVRLASDLAEQALARNPRHERARALLAGARLRDLDFVAAERILAEGLAQRPRDLDLLSVAAAVRFLAEDESGFQQRVEEVLGINPLYARVFLVVSEYAEWEHRYADMERLLRRAARIDPADGAVRGRLGLTLVRSGSDSAGVIELRRAFELDPYDVRVLNTLELFETILPARYEEKHAGAFRFRLPKSEAALLMRYVPTLLGEAHEDMASRYGFVPRAPTLIEIYESREHFAVRTSGLPHIGIAGVCFGSKLATVSPKGSPANLGMTLWHELAHVFHIGLSKSRVPRWLTEGLAEWETARLDRGWSRELDPELWAALEDRRLPGFENMNRAFTQAERMEDIAVAYYASGRMAAFLVEHAGMQRTRDVLADLGERGLRPEALPQVLGEPMPELDREFGAWVRRDLARYQGQFVDGPRRLSLEQAEQAGTVPGASRAARLELARAELESGRPGPAEKRLDALASEKLDAEVGYVLAQLYLATDRSDRGLRLLERVHEGGADGADLRLLAARLHLARQEAAEAARELERAGELDPRRAETWALLAGIARQANDLARELAAVERWAALSEHDGAVHRRWLELVLQVGPTSESELLVQRALWADLSSQMTHRLAARVYERLGKMGEADFEWESALLCPGPSDETREEWAKSLDGRGLRARATAVRRGPPH